MSELSKSGRVMNGRLNECMSCMLTLNDLLQYQSDIHSSGI